MWPRFKRALALENLGNRGVGDSRRRGNLRLRNPLGLDEVTEHLRVGYRGHRMGFALVTLDQVAKNLQVVVFFRSELPTVQQRIDHADRSSQAPRSERMGRNGNSDDQRQVTVSGISSPVHSGHQQSFFHVPRSYSLVGHHVSDVHLPTVEVNHHNEPELVPGDVEHGTAADLVRMRVDLPNVREAFPGSMFGHSVPGPERYFRFGPLLPKLP